MLDADADEQALFSKVCATPVPCYCCVRTATYYLLLTAHYSLLTTHVTLRTTHYALYVLHYVLYYVLHYVLHYALPPLRTTPTLLSAPLGAAPALLHGGLLHDAALARHQRRLLSG